MYLPYQSGPCGHCGHITFQCRDFCFFVGVFSVMALEFLRLSSISVELALMLMPTPNTLPDPKLTDPLCPRTRDRIHGKEPLQRFSQASSWKMDVARHCHSVSCNSSSYTLFCEVIGSPTEVLLYTVAMSVACVGASSRILLFSEPMMIVEAVLSILVQW